MTITKEETFEQKLRMVELLAKYGSDIRRWAMNYCGEYDMGTGAVARSQALSRMEFVWRLSGWPTVENLEVFKEAFHQCQDFWDEAAERERKKYKEW